MPDNDYSWNNPNPYANLGNPTGNYVRSYNESYNEGDLPENLEEELAMRDPELFAQYQFYRFSDPNSQYYQDIRKEISNTLNDISPTLGTLLGLQRAGGVSEGMSTAIATEQREIQERWIAEETGSQVRQAQLQGAQFGAEGMFNLAQLREQRRQFEESQPNFFEQILPVVGTAAGIALAPVTGGASLAASGAFAGMGQRIQRGYTPLQYEFGGQGYDYTQNWRG